jgi:hypothetical protein
MYDMPREDRPDHEACITDTEHTGRSWCDRDLPPDEWTFTDVDHAATNARAGNYLTACPDCVVAVKAAFDSQ